MSYRPVPNPATWTQADWYVDWVSGNDANDGKTALTAVKSVMGGVVDRWGTISPILPQTTTLHILSSQPVGAETILLAPVMQGSVNFVVLGTPALVAAFAAGAVVAKNRATNQQFTVAGFVAGGLAAQQLVKNTTGGKASNALIVSISGGGIATLSQPLAPVTPGVTDMFSPDPAEVDTWAITDTLEVYTLPTLNLWSVRVTGGGPGSVGTKWPGCWLQKITVPDPIFPADASVFMPSFFSAYFIFADSVVIPFLKVGQSLELARFINTYIEGGTIGDDVIFFGGVIGSYGVKVQGEGVQLDADVLCTAGSFNQFNGTTTALGLVNMLGAIEVNGFAYTFSSYGAPITWGATGSIDVAPGAVFEKPAHTWAATIFVPTLTLAGNGTGTYFTAGAPGVFTSGVVLSTANLDTRTQLFDPARGCRFTDF